MVGDYTDFEGFEDDIQPTLPSPISKIRESNATSNVSELAGNEESQVVPFAALSRIEEIYHIPVSSESSENLDFKKYFLRPEGFGSREELQKWCMDVGKEHNFTIVCKSAKIKDLGGFAQGSWLQLCCERSGLNISHQAKNHVPKTTATRKRKCGSIKCNCPFRLNASCDKNERWNVRVGCGFHNHPISTTLTGHAYAGRLDEEEKLRVLQLTNSGCRPREILTSIKNDNSRNYSTMRTIYNARRKLKIAAMQGRSLMQHFFKLAQEHHYTVEYKIDPATKKVTDLFFAHPDSVKLAQCFPKFLLLDCTYKTNRYRLPLFHVVSHTSTGATFTVAVAFMSREKEANYIWALECVKRLYIENEVPSVFVTDCEVGLISAIQHVFPTSSHLLCAWHIGKNVYAHGQKFFKLKPSTADDKDKPTKIDTIITQKEAKGKLKEKKDEKKKQLKQWYEAWKDIIMSPSEEDYQANLNKFVSTWEPTHKNAVRYVTTTWLNPYKEKFVAAWTNNIKHFDNVATSRVESAHAKLKLYLGNSRGNFVSCFLRAHCSYENEHVHVMSEFERSKLVQMHDHRKEELFSEILNFVSIKALNIMYDEINKNVGTGNVDMTCKCLARRINGLPCSCEIRELKRKGKVIQLDIIDHFWRQLSSSPMRLNRRTLPFEETPEFYAIRDFWDRATENEIVRLRAQLHPIAFPSTINIEESEESQVYRGRKSKKQLIKERSTERDPSFYQHVDKAVAIVEKLDKKRKREMLAAEKQGTNSINPEYLIHIPFIMQRFIAETQEMPMDKNCGYHVLLKQLNFKVKHHNPCRYLREVMLGNIKLKRQYYEAMWGKDLLDEVKQGIDKNDSMRMPECGFIIAEAFTTVVVYLSQCESITFVPTTLVLYPSIEKNMVAIGLVNNNHLIGLKFKRFSPLPPLPEFSYWKDQKNENATAWSTRYLGRIKKFEDLRGIEGTTMVC